MDRERPRDVTHRSGMHVAWYTALATVLMAAQPFVVRATLEGDAFPYIVLSASLCSEALKLMGALSVYRVMIPPARRTHQARQSDTVSACAARTWGRVAQPPFGEVWGGRRAGTNRVRGAVWSKAVVSFRFEFT